MCVCVCVYMYVYMCMCMLFYITYMPITYNDILLITDLHQFLVSIIKIKNQYIFRIMNSDYE